MKRSDGRHCRYHSYKHSYHRRNNNANGGLDVVPTCGRHMLFPCGTLAFGTLQRAAITSKACWSSMSSRRATNAKRAACHSNSSIFDVTANLGYKFYSTSPPLAHVSSWSSSSGVLLTRSRLKDCATIPSTLGGLLRPRLSTLLHPSCRPARRHALATLSCHWRSPAIPLATPVMFAVVSFDRIMATPPGEYIVLVLTCLPLPFLTSPPKRS